MYRKAVLFLIFLFQLEAQSYEDERNKILFEKLHTQNQKLWNFIGAKKKKEIAKSEKLIEPSELLISHAKLQKVEKVKRFQKQKE